MVLSKVFCKLLCLVLVDSYIIGNNNIDRGLNEVYSNEDYNKSDLVPTIHTIEENAEENAANAFNGVYAECFLYLSYSCIQKKTLAYLQMLNNLNEISVLGDYVKFVKANISKDKEESANQVILKSDSAEDLTQMIDTSIDKFFDNHVLRFKALGRDITVPRTVDEFVGRKKRKGGGGGGDDGGGGGHDKKKMMMMAMMCMKMKLMMMVPAMMGMMGMMSFKGMMFSMMSFMVSKMMLLMKILEAKKGGGSGGGGGGDAGWAAGGGGGGAWMPAGGQDYSGGGGGGYDANGQWQTGRSLSGDYETDRNLSEDTETNEEENQPMITYVTPVNHNTESLEGPFVYSVKNLRDEIVKIKTQEDYTDAENKLGSQRKSRSKRGIVDMIQSAYLYWLQKIIGPNRLNKYGLNYPKYKIINGVKYVYSPIRNIYKPKAPKAIQPESINAIKPTEGFKPIVMVEDYNKGEIVEVAEESRSKKNKLQKMKETVEEVVEDNPWQ